MSKIFQYFIFPAIISLATISETSAQKFTNPYSRFGIGEMAENNFVNIIAMPGLGPSYSQSKSYSLSNPASYSGLDLTTFDIGMNGRISHFKSFGENYDASRFDFSYLSLGFPISRKLKWGGGFGLKSFTRVGYHYENSVEDEINYTDVSFGEGGLSKFFIGTSFGFGNFSLGVNGNYVFGKIERSVVRKFNSGENALNLASQNDFSVGDVSIDAGILYHNKINDKINFSAGLSAGLPATLNAKRREGTFTLYDTIFFIYDTIFFNGRIDGTIEVPGIYKVGFQFYDPLKWKIGAGFTYQPWSSLKVFDKTENVADAWEAGIGGEYQPNYDAASFFKRVKYRLGIKSAITYLAPDGNNVPSYSLNFGFGIPIPRQEAEINVAFEVGRYGEKQTNYSAETFLKFHLGFILNDRWFIKRKID